MLIHYVWERPTTWGRLIRSLELLKTTKLRANHRGAGDGTAPSNVSSLRKMWPKTVTNGKVGRKLPSLFRYGIAGGETLKQDRARFFGQSKESRRALWDKVIERMEVGLAMSDIETRFETAGREMK